MFYYIRTLQGRSRSRVCSYCTSWNVQAWRPCRPWEPSHSHPILVSTRGFAVFFCLYVCLLYVWCVCVLYVPSVLWYCWLGLLTCKNRLPYNLYCVGGDVKCCSIQSKAQVWKCQFMSTDTHFWVKIGFKFQSWAQFKHLGSWPPPSPIR